MFPPSNFTPETHFRRRSCNTTGVSPELPAGWIVLRHHVSALMYLAFLGVLMRPSGCSWRKLIDYMIKKHPDDCKYCVSYGQLKGSYWTIPATSTQGTTKENDKDYIVRVALSPDVDITKLSESFTVFCRNENLV